MKIHLNRWVMSWIVLISISFPIPRAISSGIDDSDIEISHEAIRGLEILLSGSKYMTLDEKSSYKTAFTKLISQLKSESRRYKTGVDFLRHVFYLIQNCYLTDYQQFSTIHDIFDAGRYDCVSASALYALIFEALGIRYTITETNYHVYILLTTHEGQILVETTDPESGFIIDPEQIIRQTAAYEKPPTTADEDEVYLFRTRVNNEVSLEQLAGLQFFNLAIYHFNNQHFNNVMPLLNQALALYKSERILEFKILLVSR